MAGFKDLSVWQKSTDLAVSVYELCNQLPLEEKYGLAAQMKRAALSIPSNIAEGYRRNGRKEYKQFCGIALGSGVELETQLIVLSRIYQNIDTSKVTEDCVEIQRMLTEYASSSRIQASALCS